jgi:regulator of cell morphogenesis and NO signaling
VKKEKLVNQIASEVSLAEIVNRQPTAAAVLERLGLDYCCGGAQRLDDACAARGIDPAAVLDELAAATRAPTPDWASLPLAQLADHIEATHHQYLWAELPRLSALADKVTTAHGQRHPELEDVRATFEKLRAELEPHMLKEERVLFPMIRELAVATSPPVFHCGSVRNPISVMMSEHERAGELLARLHELTSGYAAPADSCASFRAFYNGLATLEADTHLHVHKENNRLFPTVVALETALPGAVPD